MGKRLSDSDVARYQRDGFLFPIDAFSPEEARGFRDRLEDCAACQRTTRRAARRVSAAPGLMALLLVAGCAAPDPRLPSNVQAETGHVDSGAGGGGGGSM